MEPKVKHFMYVPWTGLGLYGGFRGNRWLRNRIQIFKQFVIPSLQHQTTKDFVVWCSWRPEEVTNKYVRELMEYMDGIRELKTVHTFHGVCFWDDKYSDAEANDRLLTALHGSLAELSDEIGDVDYVYMTLQPSDDCYAQQAMAEVKSVLANPDVDACGFTKGYMINYQTKELAEYNPKTNPPFFTIKFTKAQFTNPLAHAKHTGPYKSHEYIGDFLRYVRTDSRMFMVGTHQDNISTVFDHPYKGKKVADTILIDFSAWTTPHLIVPFSVRRRILKMLPYKVRRKIRYLWGEKLYNWIRS